MLGGTNRNHLGRVYPDGSLDATLATMVEPLEEFPFVYAWALQPDGKILLGGGFTTLDGQPRNGIGRLNPDGSVDSTFVPPAGSDCCVLGVGALPDGKILVTGTFTNFGQRAYEGIVQLNTGGSLDATFSSVIHGDIRNFALQPDGKILIGGYFALPGGTNQFYARLNADGTVDPTFDAPLLLPNSWLQCLALQPDGKILLGGVYFRSIDGQPNNALARLHADGRLDTTFNPILGWSRETENGSVSSIAVQPDGQILIGGNFIALNGVPRTGVGRFNPDGTLDASFNAGETHSTQGPLTFGMVRGVALLTDGRILVGGDLATIQGEPRQLIARLNANGSLDSTFNTGAGGSPGGSFHPEVYTAAPQTDGKVIVSGIFTNLGGQLRNYFGRLASADAASQSLAIDPTGSVATWSRSGAGPEVEQVYFEQSNDGINYSLLGWATRTHNGWHLDGLAFPAGQHFYLRARGRAVAGLYNQSSSLVESVAQFWRLPPPFISSVQVLGGGVLQFSFTNTNAAAFSVLASDVAAPPASWENLGAPLSVGNGLYQFTDPGAANHGRRFYQVRSP
jgi:uncharacterized delta-60 repeat protein